MITNLSSTAKRKLQASQPVPRIFSVNHMAIAQITVISAWLPRLIDRHEPMDIKQDKNMEFVLTMVLIVLAPAALLSGAVMTPVYRLNRPYAKPIAIVMGLILFAALSWLIFVLLLVWSAQQGHPF